MDRTPLESLTPIDSGLDQIFFIRRRGGAVIESGSFRFTRFHVRKRITLFQPGLSLWRIAWGLGGRRGFGCRIGSDGFQRSGLLAPQLVHVVAQPGVADFHAALVKPRAHILEGVAGVEESPNLRPRLAHLARFSSGLFPRERAEAIQIQLVRRIFSHGHHCTRGFRKFTENTQKTSESFGKFQFDGREQPSFRKFQ